MIKIQKNTIKILIIALVIGFIVQYPLIIQMLNTLNPFEGLLVYYTILFIGITILTKSGLTYHNVKLDKPIQTLGILMIIFAIFIWFDWTSAWVSYNTTGSISHVPNIYQGSEDGATYYLWSQITGTTTQVQLQLASYLTYILTPIVLIFIGRKLINNKRVSVSVI